MKKLTLWMTSDGKTYEDKNEAKTRELRLEMVEKANKAIKEGCSLRQALELAGYGEFVLSGEREPFILFSMVTADTGVLVGPSKQECFLKELTTDYRIIVEFPMSLEDDRIMTKTEFAYYLRHTDNQFFKRL